MWYCARMPYEILYWPAADEALAKLEADPALARALQAVERVLLRLAENPFNPRLGTTPFQSPEYGGVSATPARFDDWYVFWQRGIEPTTIEIVLVSQFRR